jgi:periplasmic protein TonB
MAKIDLTSPEWCELIFQGKNKAYGAYKMRANSPKRHTWAMVIVVIIAAIGFSIPTLVKLATPKQKEVMTEVTTLSQLEEPEVKQEEFKKVEPVAPPPALKSSIKFTAPVIKKDEEVRDDEEIRSQEELTQTKVAISIADVKGNDELNGKDIAELKEVITKAPEAEEKPYTMVEQMPQFPGGDRELLSFIAKNLHYPTIAQENGHHYTTFVNCSQETARQRMVIRVIIHKVGWIPQYEVIDTNCNDKAAYNYPTRIFNTYNLISSFILNSFHDICFN